VSALQYALNDSAVKQRFADLGATTMPAEQGTPAALQAHLKAETEKWAPLIKKAGLYAD
jgi:putative tricarboxylic transport membrane protein